MYRSHNCGQLRQTDVGQDVVLSGWMATSRDFGGLTFIDLRDRYGITQLVFNIEDNEAIGQQARKLGREFVIRIEGQVRERSNKNPKIPTGDVEIEVKKLEILSLSRRRFGMNSIALSLSSRKLRRSFLLQCVIIITMCVDV